MTHPGAAAAWALGLICILLLAGAWGCRKKQGQEGPPAPQVAVASPRAQEITDYLDLTGNTQAVQTVQLRARVAGYLQKVLFQDGQVVKKKQRLFVIQQDTYQANLRQAEAAIEQQKAQLDFATAQYERYATLVKQKAASQSDVDNWRFQRDSAKANLLAAKAKRELAALDLTYTEVTAPFDGRIDRRLKDPGNLVGSGETTVLAEINQINPIYVYFTVSDTDLARLMKEARWAPGQLKNSDWPAELGLPAEDGYPHKGKLDFASITLTATTGTLLMRGVFTNTDGKIVPGLYARIRIPVRTMRAYLVPEETVGRDQRGTYLLSVNGQNVVQRLAIKTGPQVGKERAVIEGLSGNESIIVKGMQRAIPGKKVTPEKQRSDNKGAP